MTMDSEIVTILLDIKEQNGCMGAQLHEAARSRERFDDRLKELSQKMDMVDHRTDVIEAHQSAVTEAMVPIVKGIAAIEGDLTDNIRPDVAKLKLLTGKFTAVWGAGFAVIVWALSYFSTEIHGFFFPPHHP